MDDPNEMARHGSTGGAIGHGSPFDNLESYKSDFALSGNFINQWVAPYYMEIASYGNSEWIDSIGRIKIDITKEITLLLLGELNWRTRLVGSYFAAIKDYDDLIDIIGNHLLKSEVCCVGHIYALTLASFNNKKSVYFLNAYLDYYLTRPDLYFDQKYVLEALLYIDKINDTNEASKHIRNWHLLQIERKKLEKDSAIEVAKILTNLEGEKSADKYVDEMTKSIEEKRQNLTTEYFDDQIEILKTLKQYSR